jgi:hypothetical protein
MSTKITTIDTTNIVNIKIDVELKLRLDNTCYLSLMKPFPSFNLVDIILQESNLTSLALLKFNIQPNQGINQKLIFIQKK